jgi:hypothetical protein
MNDIVTVLHWREARPGDLGSGGLWNLLPERSFMVLDKSELVARVQREVAAGRVPAMALATVDAGISLALLRRVGYTNEQLRRAEAEAADLVKGATERVLRQENLAPARRPRGRTVQVDEEEYTRLRKLETVVERFLRSGGHPELRGALPGDDS